MRDYLDVIHGRKSPLRRDLLGVRCSFCCSRAASVPREVGVQQAGRLKNEWALTPLRVRGIERVRLHVDLTILAKLSCALARARTVPLAA